MRRFLSWLEEHPFWNWVIAISYYLLVVLPHEQVGLIISKVFEPFDRSTYDLIVLVMALIIFSLFFYLLIVSVKKDFQSNKQTSALQIFYLISTCIFSVCAWYYLIIVNIELIHFIQYAGLAILLFPIVQHYSATIFWVFLAGAVDEAYQYFYLAPDRTNYYDFNDVVINLLGGVWGLLWLWSSNIFPVVKNKKNRIPIIISAVVILLSLIALFSSGTLALYPSSNGETALYLLSKTPPIQGFWSLVYPDVVYHVIKPVEGVILILLLFLFYSGLGKKI